METDTRSFLPRRPECEGWDNPEWCSLIYISVEKAVSIICQLEQNNLLAKVAINNTYRMALIHLDDCLLLRRYVVGEQIVRRWGSAV